VADTYAELVCQEYEQASRERGTWEAHWQEIAERCLPAYSNTFTANSMNTPGAKKTQGVYDSTAQVAVGRFASVVDSLSTPMSQKWHRTRPDNDDLFKDREVRLYFDALNERLFKYRYAPQANFASQNHEVFQGMGAFGTGILFVDERKDAPGIRYRSIHLGELYLFENHQGIVDKAVRRFQMSARQAVQKWGDKLPSTIRDTANQGQMFWFLHRVAPNTEMDPTRRDFRGMAYHSCYVAETGKVLLEEGGYSSFPYPVSRYKTMSGETYGRGPGMDVLPAMKTLNEQKKIVLKAGHRAVDPVLLTHDDGVLDVSLLPGAVNAGGMSADGRALVGVLPMGDPRMGKELMDDERAVINDAFLVTLFQILMETPQMTATEVLERVKEKGILLAPTVGRQQSEYLGPLIEREIDVLSRQGLLPPLPPIMREAGGEYKIIYDSPLSRAMRAEEAAGVQRVIEATLGIVNVTGDPSPLDHFDFDVIVPELAHIQAVPERWLRDPRAIAQIRSGRAQAAQEQQQIEAAPAAASIAKTMQK
jgi:hypothetical protein